MANPNIANVAVASDHAGFELKAYLLAELARRGLQTINLGTHSPDDTDYPPFCIAVGEAVASGQADWGIVLGGSGQGEMIAANKVPGIRAALCNDPYLARLARAHNDANVLSIGARIVAPHFAVEILNAWINTPFDGGRHQRRIDMIADYERRRESDTNRA
jgi:ribose 5-phosphate isomerase B